MRAEREQFLAIVEAQMRAQLDLVIEEMRRAQHTVPREIRFIVNSDGRILWSVLNNSSHVVNQKPRLPE